MYLRYTTLSDLRRVLAEDQLSNVLSDEYGTDVTYAAIPAEPETDLIWSVAFQALAAAERTSETYIGKRYVVPMKNNDEHSWWYEAPSEVLTAILVIAKYNLYLRREPTEAVTAAYREAVAFLRRIENGDVTLNLPQKNQIARLRSGFGNTDNVTLRNLPL